MADVISVSALNKYVRSVLESDVVLTDIAIRGEISNFTRNYKTGHCYFSLKDDKAGVRAVMFRTDAESLAFAPENGMQVVARGRISLYERDGTFQMVVEYLFLDGAGAAQQAFDQLKARLGAEGLFEAAHKKPLPAFPAKLGLVTSKTGAALQDILNVAQRRCPLARLLLAPVTVQGERAVREVVQAVRLLDEDASVEVIIVARGGGSAEDLWVFNAEEIARAAFSCKTPLVSAIGHEVDVTILDFVADLRAPTPTAAAELALPDLETERRKMMNDFANISNNIQLRMESCYNRMDKLRRLYARQHPAAALQRCNARLAAAQRQAGRLATGCIKAAQTRLGAAAGLAEGLNPYSVLARGYAVAKAGGQLVRSVAQVRPQQPLEVTLQDGRLGCLVQTITKKETDLNHEAE